MPNRIIKESICTSDSVDQLTWFEECLFYRLIVNCDDFGRYDGRPAIIKNRLFPLKIEEREIPLSDISIAIQSLVKAELVTLYVVNKKPYLQLNTWESHQSIRAKKSKYPSPDESNCIHLQANDFNCNQVHANAPVIQSNPIQSESKENGVKHKRFTPPSLEEVKGYCQERGNSVDPQAFIDFYTSKGWKIGKETMKDWQAAVRTWERRETPAPRKSKQYVTADQYTPPNSKIDATALEQLKRDFKI